MSFVKPPVLLIPPEVFGTDDPSKAQETAALQRYGQRLYLPDFLTWELGNLNTADGAARQVGGYRWAHRAGVVRSGRLVSGAPGAGPTFTFQIHWFDASINDHTIWAAAGDRITSGATNNWIEKPATGQNIVVDPTNPNKLGIFWVEVAAVSGAGILPTVTVEVLLDPVETN